MVAREIRKVPGEDTAVKMMMGFRARPAAGDLENHRHGTAMVVVAQDAARILTL
jgi:hypothetical protein